MKVKALKEPEELQIRFEKLRRDAKQSEVVDLQEELPAIPE